jgi:uncharacterized protein (TIGR02001 family)
MHRRPDLRGGDHASRYFSFALCGKTASNDHEIDGGVIMFRKKLKSAAIYAAVISAAMGSPAFADDSGVEDSGADEEQASGPIAISATVTAVSDYRFRGLSLSNKDFAVQPSINITHESGAYVGAWASNIAPNSGDDIEVDVYAGFAGGDALTYDIGVTAYLYPGASALNYTEVIGKLGTTYGPVTLGGIVAYAPSQDGTGNTDNIYVGGTANLGVPGTPLTLISSLGLEDGAFGDNKVDWSLGVNASVAGFTLGASYIDTNRFASGLGKAGVVFSIAYSF